MNQICLVIVIIPTLMFSFILGSMSWYNFQLALSKAPNLTLDISFSKTRKIIYYKIFLIENLTVLASFSQPA